jgi:hypothetical protein
MPIASAPGGLYQALITSEPCEGGFKAKILHVLLLTTRSVVGTEVDVQFPEQIADSKQLAERRIEAHFRAWAQMECAFSRSTGKKA